ANARPLLVALSNLAARRRDDAARRLRDRDIVARQRVSHHAAAVDQPHDVVAIAAAPLDEIADRRADRRLDVTRAVDAAAGDRDDTRRHGLAARREPVERLRCTDVLAHVSDRIRERTARYRVAGQELDQLALAAGRVDRRNLA